MKPFILFPALAAILAAPLLAEPHSRTVTVDRPNVEATRTTVRDPQAGTVSRDAEATRKRDGATATRSYDRVRTDTGYTASGTATGFNGKTRSYTGSRTRTETGHISNHAVRNGSGETVYNRDASVSRANGQVSRSVNVTRKQGVRPRIAGRPGRGRR